MKLKTLVTAALALLAAGLLSVPDSAEAKRFGGGGSVGKQYNMPRQAQTPQQGPTQQAQPPGRAQPQATAPGQRAPQASGASRWLGPLAGLAAGGLLASLFFGDAFQGFQIMDFLLIVLLAVGGFFLIRALLRRGRPRQGPAAAGAYGGSYPGGGATATASARNSAGPLGRGSQAGTPPSAGLYQGSMGSAAPRPAGSDQFPYWFDGPAFLEGARSHFIRLQAAWDAADFAAIREYVTPDLFAELERERARSESAQETEVVRLQAELLTIQRDGDLAVASIRFSGLIREEAQGAAAPFSEIWHVQHPWASPQGDWYIAGIQQQEQ